MALALTTLLALKLETPWAQASATRELIHLISIGFILDSYWIPIGFLSDSYWIPIGFLLDSCWIPIGFLLRRHVAKPSF